MPYMRKTYNGDCTNELNKMEADGWQHVAISTTTYPGSLDAEFGPEHYTEVVWYKPADAAQEIPDNYGDATVQLGEGEEFLREEAERARIAEKVQRYKDGWRHVAKRVEGIAGWCVVFQHPTSRTGEIIAQNHKTEALAQDGAKQWNTYIQKAPSE